MFLVQHGGRLYVESTLQIAPDLAFICPMSLGELRGYKYLSIVHAQCHGKFFLSIESRLDGDACLGPHYWIYAWILGSRWFSESTTQMTVRLEANSSRRLHDAVGLSLWWMLTSHYPIGWLRKLYQIRIAVSNAASYRRRCNNKRMSHGRTMCYGPDLRRANEVLMKNNDDAMAIKRKNKTGQSGKHIPGLADVCQPRPTGYIKLYINLKLWRRAIRWLCYFVWSDLVGLLRHV